MHSLSIQLYMNNTHNVMYDEMAPDCTTGSVRTENDSYSAMRDSTTASVWLRSVRLWVYILAFCLI